MTKKLHSTFGMPLSIRDRGFYFELNKWTDHGQLGV